MLEKILFSNTIMPGETARLLLAFAGTAITAYYDIFNNRNVPEKLLYAFLVLAFTTNIAFYSEELFLFAIATAAVIGLFGYVFYRAGQLGGADVLVIVSIMLLLPVHPVSSELPFNFPFIFSAMVFAGSAFAIYIIVFYGLKVLSSESKPRIAYLLLLVPYLIFAYVYYTSFLFQPVYFGFVTLLFTATVFFLVYKEDLNSMLSEKVPVQQLEEEEVLALEQMDPEIIKKYALVRLLTKHEIQRLKQSDLNEVAVFTKLPPFLPFLLFGMVAAVFFAKSLLFL